MGNYVDDDNQNSNEDDEGSEVPLQGNEEEIVIEDDEDNLDYPDSSKKSEDELREVVFDRSRSDRQEKPEGKKKGNVFAALRRSERDNKILTDRFEKLINAIGNQGNRTETPEPEEELPPFDDNPIGHVNAKQDKILKKLDQKDVKEQENEKRSRVIGQLREADQAIGSFREEVGGEAYDSAINYLLQLRINDIADSYPDLTEEEINVAIADQAMQEKYRLVGQGKNPGKVFYNYAKRHGFKESSRQPAKRQDAREDLSRARHRDERSSTISSVPGRAAKGRLSSGDFVGMSEDEFDDYVSGVSKDKGRRYGAVSIADLVETRKGR